MYVTTVVEDLLFNSANSMPTRSQPRVTKVWISTGGKNPQEERVKETPYGGANMSKNKQVVSHGVNAMKSSPENIEKVISGKKERWDPQRI